MPEAPISSDSKSDYTFGQVAIKESFASFEQVKECLDIQTKLRSIGVEPKRLGDILIEKGYLTSDQAMAIVRSQQTQAPAQAPKVSIPGYELIAKIGQGAMGAVYRARQLSMDRLVAVKVLSPKYGKDRGFVERFVREARAVAKLNHENVIAGIDVGETNGIHFFVMEFVDGVAVSNILRKETKLDERRCLDIGLQIARALDHAHKHGMVHRDVKPENIMVTKDGIAKLCDLGLAKQQKEDASLTMDGMSVGTPNYISPEQARGEQNIDIRSDIYSLGASLYHMATGTTPFTGPNSTVVMTKHVTEYAEPPMKRNPAVPEGLNNLILKMMGKHREDRPQDPESLIADLEFLIRGGPVTAAAPPRPSTRAGRIGADTPKPERVSLPPHPVVHHAAAPARSGIAGPMIGVLALLALAAGAYAIFSTSSTKEPNPGGTAGASGSGSPGDVPGDRPGDGGGPDQAAFDRDHDSFVKLRDQMITSKDPDRFTKPYARCEEYLRKYERTPFETDWIKEMDEYKSKVNQLILEKEWGPTREEAKKLQAAGQYARAVEKAKQLDDVYKYFKKSPAVPTDAAADQVKLVKEIEEFTRERYTEGRREIASAKQGGKHDAAYETIHKMMETFGEEKAEDLRKYRAEIFEAEIAALLGDAPTPEKFLRAQERIRELQTKFGQHSEFARLLDTRSRELKEREEKTATDAVGKASFVYTNEFAGPFEKALEKRDLLAARRLLHEVYFGDKYAVAAAGFQVNGLDLKVLKAYLDPARTEAADFAAIVTMAEAGYSQAQLTQREAAGRLCLDLRVYALLDEILEQSLRGAEMQGRDSSKFRDYSDALKNVLEVKARKPGDPAYRMVVKRSSSESEMVFAPRDSAGPTDADIVLLAKKSYAGAHDKDPYYPLRNGLLFLFGGNKPMARQWLKLVTKDPAKIAHDRYWSRVAGVATPDEETEAKKKFLEVTHHYGLKKKLSRDALLAVLKDLRDNFAHTQYMTTLTNDFGKKMEKSRLDLVKEYIAAEEGGGGGTPKKAKSAVDLFAPGTLAAKGTRFESTYDFDKEDELKDFNAVNTAGQLAVAKQDKGVKLTGSGYWYWKAPVKGNVTVEMTIKSLSDQGIGLVICGDGTVKGFVAYADYSVQRMGKMGIIFKLPVTDPRDWANFTVAQGGRRVQLKKDTIYVVRLVRDGKKIQLTFNNEVAVEGESDAYTDGLPGIALANSEIIVEKLKMNVEIRKDWLDEQLKK